jgi:hypothetical protein
MNVDRLFQLAAPHLHLLVATPGETCDFARSLRCTPGRKAVIRILRGSKAETVSRLFDEVAAALQFPYYFGENWDALDECLGDLEWLPGDAYILFFTEAHRLLDRDAPEKFKLLLDVLENAVCKWSSADNLSSELPSRPFHVVFQCSAEHAEVFLTRIKSHGRSVDRLS